MPFRRAMILGGIPALCMAISTYIGLGKQVHDDIQGALQHFAAGVLLCTVGTELLPEIVKAQGYEENLAAFIGFFLGVTVLILLGMFAPEEEEHPEDEHQQDKERRTADDKDTSASDDGDDNSDDSGVNNMLKSPTPGQRQQLRELKFVIVGRKFRRQRQTIRSNAGKLVIKRSMSLSSLPMVTEGDPLIVPSDSNNNKLSSSSLVGGSYTEEQPGAEKDKQEGTTTTTATAKQFPLAFVLAVAIDSSLDGLLIGIASAAGPSAGPMMSASLSVEMGFLGLTLATTLSGQSLPKAALAALAGPVCLVLAAGLGGALADTLSHSPVALVGMLSFGASALLFMVAEELLLDAHEDGEHVWWVDLQLYTGFFTSIVAGKFIK